MKNRAPLNNEHGMRHILQILPARSSQMETTLSLPLSPSYSSWSYASFSFGKEALCVFEAKNQVLSEMIPKSPNGPKMAPNDQKHVILVIWDHFGPS